MHIFRGILVTAAGLFLLICGTTRSQFVVYRLLVARSGILCGEGVHRFYQVSGLIVMILGVLWACGVIWNH